MSKWPWDHIYILNLEHMKYKYDKLKKKLHKVGIKKNIERFIATYGLKECPYGNKIKKTKNINEKWLLIEKMNEKLKKKNIISKYVGDIYPYLRPGEIGHLISFIKICKDAKDKKYEKILILEDDATFNTKSFKKKFLKAYKNVPNDYDILYLGIHEFHNIKMGKPIKLNEYICKLKGITSKKHPYKKGGIYGTHAMILNQKAINSFIKKALPLTLASDVIMGQLENKYNLVKSYYICDQLVEQITYSTDKSTTREI